jgi:hypothetical protein
VSPERRRRAVTVLQQRFGVSQRRACRVVGQHRSAQRRPAPRLCDADTALRARLRQISARYPRWGWRKAHAIAAREGLVVNRKRTRRLWLDEGLKRPPRARKKRRAGAGRHQRMRATRPDQMWALDYQVDVTANVGRCGSSISSTSTPAKRSLPVPHAPYRRSHDRCPGRAHHRARPATGAHLHGQRARVDRPRPHRLVPLPRC